MECPFHGKGCEVAVHVDRVVADCGAAGPSLPVRDEAVKAWNDAPRIGSTQLFGLPLTEWRDFALIADEQNIPKGVGRAQKLRERISLLVDAGRASKDEPDTDEFERQDREIGSLRAKVLTLSNERAEAIDRRNDAERLAEKREKAIKEIQLELAESKRREQRLRDERDGSVWIWQDEDNDLSSIACPILIGADQMRALYAEWAVAASGDRAALLEWAEGLLEKWASAESSLDHEFADGPIGGEPECVKKARTEFEKFKEGKA